jgi:peptide/nickel transport system substrate-binding protein
MRMNAIRPLGGLLAAAVFVVGLAQPVLAKTFRWSSQGDFLTMDPHAQNESLNNTAASYIYEPLVSRDKQMQVEPALAVSWSQPEANRWRFVLRQNVKFHDGTPFTADDVVFTVQRVLAPSSNFKQYLTGVAEARKIDDHTVEIITNGPNPVLLQQLTEVRIMSKAWSEKHNVTKPQNFVEKEETYAVRNTNGTGPYILKVREPDVRTIMEENPNSWG